jgi:aspartyl-tRNA(Asn)/glutamyl-tRNA(Gln) amidotransferase subunit B
MNSMFTTDFEPVIGLEIHVQLSTQTKMFCGCALSFGEEPNTLTCPICLGHPGTLPTLNAQAVHYGLMIGLALGCEIAPRSIFHRKNYFYPDLPKGYQISQYDLPLATGGELAVPGGATVRIHRVHLEEDAAKLIHLGESGRIHGAGHSIVDFNRGGTPLVEIVTEPDLRSPSDARQFLQLLRTTLKQIGVSDVNMEEGSLRCDANVSVRKRGDTELRTKTELKNMNSFRFVERGLEAEIARQIKTWESGGSVAQETLHFDPVSGSLTPLRSKEEVHDYRYFPEPDLVPVVPTEEMLETARGALPELPAAWIERLEADYGLPADTASILVGWVELGSFYEEALAAELDGERPDPRTLAAWVTGELVARLRLEGLEDPRGSKLSPHALSALVGMVERKALSQSAAKEVLAELTHSGGEPQAIVESKGLAPIAETGELEAIVQRAIAANADAAEKVRAGKTQAISAIVGSVMKETKGRADGAEVTRLIKENLGLGSD